MDPGRGKRPRVDREIDALLRERLSPIAHRSWWHAEHALLSGITAREALAAGERQAVKTAASLRPGGPPPDPLLSPVRAGEITVELNRRAPRRD